MCEINSICSELPYTIPFSFPVLSVWYVHWVRMVCTLNVLRIVPVVRCFMVLCRKWFYIKGLTFQAALAHPLLFHMEIVK